MNRTAPLLDGDGAALLDAWREAGDLGGFPERLGFTVEAFGEGWARLTLEVEASHANLMGAVHGGVMAGLMDAATGCALLSTLSARERFATADLHVRYLGGAPSDGRVLKAHAELVKKGRTLAVAEGRVYDAAAPETDLVRASASMVIRAQG